MVWSFVLLVFSRIVKFLYFPSFFEHPALSGVKKQFLEHNAFLPVVYVMGACECQIRWYQKGRPKYSIPNVLALVLAYKGSCVSMHQFCHLAILDPKDGITEKWALIDALLFLVWCLAPEIVVRGFAGLLGVGLVSHTFYQIIKWQCI